MRTPPTTLTNTSWSRSRDAAVAVQHREQHREPVRFEARRRRGADSTACASSTSACTSTSSGRVPSRVTITHAARRRAAPCRDRKIADGLRTSCRPCSAIANTPSSLAAPKRFLTARTTRKRLPVSPSKYSTVSTMCSSTRGPAIAPSLVTWPIRSTAVPVSFAKRTSARRGLAHLRCRARRRFAELRSAWSGSSRRRAPSARGGRGVARGSSRRASRRAAAALVAASPSRRARRRPGARDSSPVTYSAGALARSARRPPAAAASTCRCPGSPPSSTTDPATRPPPSTRSSSPMPVAARSSGSCVISVTVLLKSAGGAARACRALRRQAHRRRRQSPACSRPRRPGTGPAIAVYARRRRRRRSSFWAWAMVRRIPACARLADASTAHPRRARMCDGDDNSARDQPLYSGHIMRQSTADSTSGPDRHRRAIRASAHRAAGPPPAMLGRYQIENELGKGAMGVVYLGRDPKINRVVAIKAIPLAEEFEADELDEARAQFFREAEMAGACSTRTSSRSSTRARTTAWPTSRWSSCAAATSSSTRARRGCCLPTIVIEIVGALADALHYAHQQQSCTGISSRPTSCSIREWTS